MLCFILSSSRIWQSLQCRGSEEIIEVLTSCEDIFPVYSSCLNFADDELGLHIDMSVIAICIVCSL